ncbi:MAG: hypothetical protein AAF567_07620 [Actinomycetota bacterium]
MADRPVMALRTPLYLILAAIGVLIFLATFLPWATVASEGSDISVAGVDAGGWGAAALVAGLGIAAVSLIGYVWNPFSDPEALFIAGFGVATLIAAIAKLGDVASFVDPADDFTPDAQVGVGLWLILLASIVAIAGSAWIVVSRPSAERRLGDDE